MFVWLSEVTGDFGKSNFSGMVVTEAGFLCVEWPLRKESANTVYPSVKFGGLGRKDVGSVGLKGKSQ